MSTKQSRKTQLKDLQNFLYNGRLYAKCGPASMSIDNLEGETEIIKTPDISNVILLSGKVEVPNRHYYFDCNGYLHREDGPAYITSDRELWYKHGLLHREDGPAVIGRNSRNDRGSWYLNGVKLTDYEVMFLR